MVHGTIVPIRSLGLISDAINLIQHLIRFLCPLNYIIWLLAHISNILTNQLIMITGKGCADVTNTIEANRFMMSNTIAELANMSEIFVNISLVLTFPFVWEDLKEIAGTGD